MEWDMAIRIIQSVDGLAYEINEQTKAITALVESNQRLMMILVEGMSEDEALPSTTYLDGSPK